MTLDDLKPFLDWLEANPGLAGFATFVISIAESLAIIGLLIPGTLVMGAIGTLIGAGILPGLDITLWAIAGAVVGDGLSYWLGHHYHGHIREMWPFRTYPSLLQKGEAFFHKHGGKSIFLGRFIGPVRPMIPVIAGMLNMSPIRFTISNVLSAIAWAPAYMLPGVLLGAISVQLAPATGSRFLIMLILAALGLWCVYAFLKWVLRWFFKIVSIPLSIVSLILITLFVLLAALDYFFGTETIINTLILHMMLSIRVVSIDKVMIAINCLGDLRVLAAVFVVVLAWTSWKQWWQQSLSWLMVGAATVVALIFLQYFIPSEYPAGFALSVPTYGSFPNVSVALATALFGYIAILGARLVPKHATWFYGCAFLLVGLIALSELYLCKGWFNDIIGGFLLGWGFAIGATVLGGRLMKQPETIPLLGLLSISLIALLLSWGWIMQHYYQLYTQHYVSVATPYKTLDAKAWWSAQQMPDHPYRQGSFTRARELLTIQWAGDLNAIQRELMANGWEVAPKPDFATLVNRIAAKNREQQLPLWPRFYQNRKPALIMTKLVGHQQRLLILRLWDAKILLNTPDSVPLWLGTITYHTPWQATALVPFKRKNRASLPANLMPGMAVLINSLSTFEWKTISPPLLECMKEVGNMTVCQNNILLIRKAKTAIK